MVYYPPRHASELLTFIILAIHMIHNLIKILYFDVFYHINRYLYSEIYQINVSSFIDTATSIR